MWVVFMFQIDPEMFRDVDWFSLTEEIYVTDEFCEDWDDWDKQLFSG